MTLLSLSTTAANTLAASIVQGLLLALAVALCLRLIPRIPAAARSLIWTAVFTLILVLPFLPAHHPAAHSVAINPLWTLPLAVLWLAASLVRAIQLIFSARALRRLARTATPVPHPSSPTLPYTLCTSSEVDRPSVIGFFSRRILLPSALYASLASAELHHVLLHETEHLRRRDDWTNLLQKLALVLVPLNPVLLWVERRLCLERELACDDRVLRATGTPKAYATCLTHLAEHSLFRRSLTLALGLLGCSGLFNRQSELSRRVHRILLAPQQAISPGQARTATAALLAALAGTTLTLAHTPQLIRFSAPSTQIASIGPISTATGNASFQPATFRSSVSIATPTLVKAVQTSTAKPRLVHRVRHSVPRTRPDAVPTLQAEWTAPAETRRSQRLVLTTASGEQVSYTFVSTVAVVTPHGWIIFQL